MPLFTYRATDEESKEVHGTIEAADADSARQTLADAHVEVLEVTEASRSKASATNAAEPVAATFAFEGRDSAGVIRRGTVQATDKRSAFEQLKKNQGLTLSMLSPAGATPQFRDPDLERWQKVAAPVAPTPIVKPKPIGFSLPDGTVTATSQVKEEPKKVSTSTEYYPLLSTLRLYGGWLLAWYGLFVALGYYAHVRTMPWSIPFVEAFFLSPLIFSFTVAIFLFLLLTSVHRAMHGKLISGALLTIVGIAAFVSVRMSL